MVIIFCDNYRTHGFIKFLANVRKAISYEIILTVSCTTFIKIWGNVTTAKDRMRMVAIAFSKVSSVHESCTNTKDFL
ncbi:protein of unknown function [Nitrospina watsonii]|uniref:Tc1-like transposase DDE domain-containing protein n=1 Tax=Nitrospina watsonii TaxID=1323948 RepID=A0ABM9HDW6_9BACT|nr:protein of unknown function [Nitrospina watsonii]